MIDELNKAKRTVKERKFKKNEVLLACLEYFKGDELAATTWMNKYAMKNSNGDFLELTPDDMHQRMARFFFEAELFYITKTKKKNGNYSKYGLEREHLSEERIYSLFKGFKYIIPQGSVMAALGNNHIIASLSNCVVLPEVNDSYGGI